jgi:hypothetical protein
VCHSGIRVCERSCDVSSGAVRLLLPCERRRSVNRVAVWVLGCEIFDENRDGNELLVEVGSMIVVRISSEAEG